MHSLLKQNTKYELVIFDFDGTIADTSAGIIDSHKYTLKNLHLASPSDNELRTLIGNNLLKTYIEVFGLNESSSRHAVDLYRRRYSKVGIHKATVYPGFREMLSELKKAGCKIGLATLKSEKFSIVMLGEINCLPFFDYIFGMDNNDIETKTSLIKKTIEASFVPIEKCLYVGDTIGDYEGAKRNNIDFLGVTYGFGFETGREYAFNTVDTPYQILRFITTN